MKARRKLMSRYIPFVMARLDPRFRGDATQPTRVRAANESYDRLDGPLSRTMTSGGRVLLALALQLGRFAQGNGALELGEVIDEQAPVDVIDLVLQAGRQQPLRGDGLPVPVLVGVFGRKPGGAFHIVPDLRQ